MLRESEEEVERREELRDALHAAYAAGVTMTVLGRVLGVSRQRISAILKE
jgi:DNA-binding transcriptional regulator LsrR (DeoR family)